MRVSSPRPEPHAPVREGAWSTFRQRGEYPEVDRLQWRKIDAQLCSVLWQSVDPKILLHLWAYKTCFKFWNQAKGLYTNDIQCLYKVEFLTLMPLTTDVGDQRTQIDKFFMVLTLIGLYQILRPPRSDSWQFHPWMMCLPSSSVSPPLRLCHLITLQILLSASASELSTSQGISLTDSEYDDYLCYQVTKSAFVTSVAQTGNASACLIHTSSLGPWILDSSASDHISSNKDLFSSITTTSAYLLLP
ncbi:hypothetical protein CK203_117210 [Vitis vinifera]|uniref:Uncharacterized protein n=1 Tax=Vitis vinifera TaxID=29760 RepID=A0A438BLR4_VITVI|nr:hypothetical protein CK203_117210 [Vitis vinifera]